MAARHVVISISLFIVLVALKTHLRSFNIGCSEVKPSLWTSTLSYRAFSIKVSCYHRVKNPAVKWTKRGLTVICLTEPAYASRFACTDSILLCGDIHPQPGPNNLERLGIRTNTPARIMYTASQLLSFKNISHLSALQSTTWH